MKSSISNTEFIMFNSISIIFTTEFIICNAQFIILHANRYRLLLSEAAAVDD